MPGLNDRIALLLDNWYQFIQSRLVDADLVALAQRSGLLSDSDPSKLSKLQSFADALNTQDPSALPQIITRPQDQLGGAKAAFLTDSSTIILNQDWLLSQNTTDLDFIDVLTEQVAYFLAASLQQTDELHDDDNTSSAAQTFATDLLANRSDLEQLKTRESASPADLISINDIGENLKALRTSRPAGIGEYQSAQIDHQWQTVELQQAYRNPVILVSDPTFACELRPLYAPFQCICTCGRSHFSSLCRSLQFHEGAHHRHESRR